MSANQRHLLISGSGRGIGRALAEHFLERGDRVAGCSRGPSTFEHPCYEHFCLDVHDDAAVRTMFGTLRRSMGHLDALINNAGTARMSPAMLMPSAAAQQVMDVNFMGTFHLTQHAIRLLRHAQAGRIVNLSSVAVPWRLEGEAVYAASKAAVETFTRVLAKELGPMGVTVNALGPTPIRTDLIAGVPEKSLQALVARQALEQWAEPADVIHTVEFFLDPRSRMITGQVIYLGGAG